MMNRHRDRERSIEGREEEESERTRERGREDRKRGRAMEREYYFERAIIDDTGRKAVVYKSNAMHAELNIQKY